MRDPDHFEAVSVPPASPTPTAEPPWRKFPTPERTPATRPPQRQPKPATEPLLESSSSSGQAGSTHVAKGTATWYCLPGRSVCPRGYSGGMYAAAGPALRVGKWRGRVVTVCASGRCVTVTLVDWCACGDGRVIDLFGDAFRRLAPLSRGTIRGVVVKW